VKFGTGVGIGFDARSGFVAPEVVVAGAVSGTFFALWFLKAGVRIGGHLSEPLPDFCNYGHQYSR